MIKIQFDDEKIKKAFEELSSQFAFIKNSQKNIDITCNDNIYTVKSDGVESVKFSNKTDIFRAVANYVCGFEINTEKSFERFGIMLDCARNAVPSVDGLKKLIPLLVLNGYNYLGLYLEDCLEVSGEPYFGYMRGRYSNYDIKEIVEYADLFGLEVVPYVQTLAHLYTIFHHWEQYYNTCRDINDILLMGEDRTYTLIENIVKTVSQLFKSKRIHIGMDEAFLMTYGKYKKLHDNFDRNEVFISHVNRVVGICEKYGLQPYAWGDMFLKHVNKDSMPKNLSLSAWEYNQTDEKYYADLIDGLRKITNNVEMSSAAHKWYGYAPLNEYSINCIDSAIKGSQNKTDSFCLTLWGDDGAECSYNAVLFSIIRTANKVLKNPLNDEQLSEFSVALTGYDMSELLALDLPNKVFDCPMDKVVNVSKYLLFEDVFMGISDRNESEVYQAYFVKNGKIMKDLAKRQSYYNFLFDEMAKLCEVLSIKCTLRLQLLCAYQNKDNKKLRSIANIKIPQVIKKVKVLKDAVETTWLKENKTQGFEIQNLRLGALIERLSFCRRYINKFLSGKIKKIEELEIDLSPEVCLDKYNGAMCFNSYEQNVTYGNISMKQFS